jgi:hypothetical protein
VHNKHKKKEEMIHHATDLSVGTGQTKWNGSWQAEEQRKATPARAGNEGAWLEGRVAAPLRSHSIVSDDSRHHRYLGTSLPLFPLPSPFAPLKIILVPQLIYFLFIS